MERNRKLPAGYAELPDTILRHIFSFLLLNDLINAQKVCTLWRTAGSKSSTWKFAPLILCKESIDTVIKQLTNVPYLHTICGVYKSGDELVEALLTYVVDLRKINVYFTNQISASYFQKLIEKFENLEFVILYNTAPDTVDSLKVLSTCLSLKDLCLVYDGTAQNFSDICKIIGNGFLSLKRLWLYHLENKEANEVDLSYIILKKISQLTYLVLSIDNLQIDVLRTIFESTTLEKLVIHLSKQPQSPINLQSMANLKHLSIRFKNQCSADICKQIVFPPSVERVSINLPHRLKIQTTILGNIISSSPKVQHLLVLGINDTDINQQLKNIHHLSHLQTISLYKCANLSNEGVEHITNCKNLRCLEFQGVTFKDYTYECFQKCTYLQYLNLYLCTLNTDKLLPTILEMKYLTNFQMYMCYNEVEHDGITPLNKDIIRKLMEECRHQNHYVNIYDTI